MAIINGSNYEDKANTLCPWQWQVSSWPCNQIRTPAPPLSSVCLWASLRTSCSLSYLIHKKGSTPPPPFPHPRVSQDCRRTRRPALTPWPAGGARNLALATLVRRAAPLGRTRLYSPPLGQTRLCSAGHAGLGHTRQHSAEFGSAGSRSALFGSARP